MNTNAWYHPATDYVLEESLMNGYADGTFHPSSTLSRAQLCQILNNSEGRPAVSGGSGFADVPNSLWCADMVAWASDNGIVTGYGDGTFRPDGSITREQLATMLWRYAGSPESSHSLERYTDAAQISSYAREALAWANENTIVNGYGDGRLGPKGVATRAHVAQMLKSFLTGIE